MVKYLSFHNSSFTLRYILFNVNGKASVTHLVLLLCKCELFWAQCCKQKFPSHKHNLCKFNLSSVLNFYIAYFLSKPGNLLLCSWWSVEKKPLMSRCASLRWFPNVWSSDALCGSYWIWTLFVTKNCKFKKLGWVHSWYFWKACNE